MSQDFTDVMSQRSNEELIRIVTRLRDDYQPKAVEAAEKELESRSLEPEVMGRVRQSIIEKEESKKSMDSGLVSSGLRFIHWIVDGVVFILLALVLGFLVSLTMFKADELVQILVINLILFVSFASYFVFMEYRYQKTLGKFITKTKVVMKDGRKPELNEIVLRTLCRLIPFDRISFVFTRNGFHDMLSSTKVVKDSVVNKGDGQ